MSKKPSQKKPGPVQARKGGRPSKLPTLDLDQVMALASLGMSEERIAYALRVSPKTIYNWKEKDPTFLQVLLQGRAKADAQVLQSLFNKATGRKVVARRVKEGMIETIARVDPDTAAIKFYLTNRLPEDWKDRQQVDNNLNITEKLSLADFRRSMKGATGE